MGPEGRGGELEEPVVWCEGAPECQNQRPKCPALTDHGLAWAAPAALLLVQLPERYRAAVR
jgi:hypothetical protein